VPSFALVVGKFCPLHKGHLLLIERALAASERVCVLSYTSLEAPGCDTDRRRAWLEACLAHAGARVVIHVLAPEACPADDADADTHRRFCADRMRAWHYDIDAVFTSEHYGDGFAGVLGEELGHPVTHVRVDLERTEIPFSGTQGRALLELFLRDAGTAASEPHAAELRRWLPEPVFRDLTSDASRPDPTRHD
jgi:HTH-type transcriptional repressor of NAD biosynthesis genes